MELILAIWRIAKICQIYATKVLFNAYTCSCMLETMVLLKYLKKKEEKQLTLPTIQNGIDTSLTEKDLECANKNVSTILLSNDCVNEMRMGKYNSYMPKERAKLDSMQQGILQEFSQEI